MDMFYSDGHHPASELGGTGSRRSLVEATVAGVRERACFGAQNE